MPNIRSLVASVVTLASLAAAGGLALTGWSPVSRDAPAVSTAVQPVAVSRNLVCSGAVLASVADSTSWTRVGKSTVGISGGHIAAQLTTDSDPIGAVVAYDDTPDAVAATESTSLNTDIAAGYLAAECGDPSNSQWLVGGSTTTGRDGVLTISNGSAVDARVDLEFWGANGPISAPAAAGLVISAGSQESYSLAGFAPNENSPVIHVTSTGAAVWATLQVSTVRGLTPGGLDRITGIAEPSTSMVIPAVRQPKESVIGPLRADSDYLDTVTELRLFTPGDADATASVTVTPFDGTEPVTVTATATANDVLDIPIDELASGDYSVSIESDQPVLAAIRFASHSTSTQVTDMAWATGVLAHTGASTAFVPQKDSLLALVNPSDSDVAVSVVSAGTSSTVTVAAHSSTTVAVGRGALRVESDGPIAASVLVETSVGVAVITLPSEPLGARSVTVIAH